MSRFGAAALMMLVKSAFTKRLLADKRLCSKGGMSTDRWVSGVCFPGASKQSDYLTLANAQ